MILFKQVGMASLNTLMHVEYQKELLVPHLNQTRNTSCTTCGLLHSWIEGYMYELLFRLNSTYFKTSLGPRAYIITRAGWTGLITLNSSYLP